VLSIEEQMAWAMRKDSPKLKKLVDDLSKATARAPLLDARSLDVQNDFGDSSIMLVRNFR